MRKECPRVVIGDFANHLFNVTASAQLLLALGDCKRITWAPIPGTVYPDSFLAIHFKDVCRALWGALCIWIECHSGPEPSVKYKLNGVFFNVINKDSARVSAGILECINDEPGAFELVFEMRRVDQNHLIMLHSKIDVLFKNSQFIS